MAGKLNVFGLGEKGVNLVKSRLHLDDGELTQAQNAEFFRDQGRGALRKRAGLARFNLTQLAGIVYGLIGVPLPGPGQRQIWVAQNPGSGGLDSSWAKSTDGATFATLALATDPQPAGSQQSLINGFRTLDVNNVVTVQPCVQLPYGFFYLGEDPRGVIYHFNGSTDFEFIRLPNASVAGRAAGPLFLHQQQICCGVLGAVTGRVYVIDPLTGESTDLANDVFVTGTEHPYSGASYLGRIWVGTTKTASGRILSARVGETTWTVERTAGASHACYTSLATFRGSLFAATLAKAGTAAIIEKRTPDGTWSTSATGSHSVQFNYFDGLVVFQDALYAIYRTTGATEICQIHKFDGTTWTTDYDLFANDGDLVVGKGVAGTSLYFSTMGTLKAGIFRKVSAGAWSKVYAGNIQHGEIGVI